MIIRRMAISHVKCLNGSRLQQTISIANFRSQSAVVWDKSKSGAANQILDINSYWTKSLTGCSDKIKGV